MKRGPGLVRIQGSVPFLHVCSFWCSNMALFFSLFNEIL